MTGNNLVFISSDGHGNRQEEYWTTVDVVDRPHLEMVETKDGALGWEDYQAKEQKEKYYDRAKKAIDTKQCPMFIINISDLSLQLKKDLNNLGDPTWDRVDRESTGRDMVNLFDANRKGVTLNPCKNYVKSSGKNDSVELGDGKEG